jgi:peptide deformylase
MFDSSELATYKLQGNILEIFKYPSPVLKRVAEPVTEFDNNLRELCLNMLYTMYKAPGIGLAAPQVGISKRIFVMDIDYDREEITKANGDLEYELSNFKPRIFINPKFKNKSGEIFYEEGCLSVPGVYEKVKRFESITVEFQDLEGKPHTLEAEGLLSICIQHENDHLDGIVFVERLSALKREFLLKKYKKRQTQKM